MSQLECHCHRLAFGGGAHAPIVLRTLMQYTSSVRLQQKEWYTRDRWPLVLMDGLIKVTDLC